MTHIEALSPQKPARNSILSASNPPSPSKGSKINASLIAMFFEIKTHLINTGILPSKAAPNF